VKRVNQTVLSVLALGLIAGAPAVAAGTTVSQPAAVAPIQQNERNQAVEKTLHMMQALVPELKALKLQVKSYEPAIENRPAVWNLVYGNDADKAKQPGKEAESLMAHMQIDAETGELLHYSFHHPAWKSSAAIDAEEAKQAAQSFLEALLGESMKHYQIADQVHVMQWGYAEENGKPSGVYHAAAVSVDRIVNGIPLRGYGMYLNIANGKIMSYDTENYGKMDLSLFPDPSKAISKTDAKTAYQKLLDMQLTYNDHEPVELKRLGTEQVKTKPVLKYSPSFYGMIDALTGKEAELFEDPKPQQPMEWKLAPKGMVLRAESREAVANLLHESFGIDVDDLSYEASERKEYSFAEQKLILHVWRSGEKEQEGGRYVTAAVEAKTGRVVNVNAYYISRKPQKPVVTMAEAEQKAKAFLEKHLPADVTKLQLTNSYGPNMGQDRIPDWVDESKLSGTAVAEEPVYRFQLKETHGGIPVDSRSYGIAVDAVTGEISSYFQYVTEKQSLPGGKPVITAEEAAALYMDTTELELVYYWPEYRGVKAPKPVLVYAAKPDGGGYRYVDAATGKLVHVAEK